MDREAGYYWVTLDDRAEFIPAAWVGGNWYLPGQQQPANARYDVHEFAKAEPPKVTRK